VLLPFVCFSLLESVPSLLQGSFLKEHQINSHAKIVKLEWISESLKKQYIADVEQYLLLR